MNVVVVFVCCFYLLLSSLLSYSSRYAEDINKILLLLLRASSVVSRTAELSRIFLNFVAISDVKLFVLVCIELKLSVRRLHQEFRKKYI